MQYYTKQPETNINNQNNLDFKRKTEKTGISLALLRVRCSPRCGRFAPVLGKTNYDLAIPIIKCDDKLIYGAPMDVQKTVQFKT